MEEAWLAVTIIALFGTLATLFPAMVMLWRRKNEHAASVPEKASRRERILGGVGIVSALVAIAAALSSLTS